MDTIYKNLLLGITLALFSHTMMAQEKVSKTISESYKMSDAGELEINNKYGDITIHGWSKNTIAITVDITTTHKKKENAESLLERIRPDIKVMNAYIRITTEISEKKSGFLSEYFSKANPFDFDRSNIQINYTIYLPSNAELVINNKFGDVILGDWTGKLRVDIQHGDIWINEDLKNADVDLKFGKLKAKNINYANIRLKNGGVSLNKTQDLRLTTSGSTIAIEEVASLELYSSKDKIDIQKVGSLRGNLEFTNMLLVEIGDKMDLDMKISEFNVSRISGTNANINLHQQSSEIVLNIKDFSFKFNATLQEGLLRLPKSFDKVESKLLDKGKKIREIKAVYGSNTEGDISITGEKGVILLKEF